MKGLTMVFGRSNERKRILDSVESHDIRTIVVYGPKYVGKSLLLHNIVTQWNEDSSYRPIYLDLESLGTSSSSEILDQLATLAEQELEIADEKNFSARPSDGSYWEEFINALPADQKLLIVLDALQPQPPLVPNIPEKNSEENEPSQPSATNSATNKSTSINASLSLPETANAPATELVPAIKTTPTSSTEVDKASNGSISPEMPGAEMSSSEDENESLQDSNTDNGEVEKRHHRDRIISESHQALLAFLSQLLQHKQIELIVGADCIEPGLVTEHFTDYLHQTRTIQLNPLGKEETEKVLLSEGMEGLVDWNNWAAHERVWELTHGHPAFISAISSSISDYVFQDIGDLRRAKIVTPDIIDSTLPQVLDKVQHTINWHWDSLSQTEKMVLSIISYVEPEGISTDAIALVLSDIELTYLGWDRGQSQTLFETRLTQVNLNNVLRRLRQLNLIEQSGHEYRLKIRLMQDWILDNHPLPEEFTRIIYNASKKPIAQRSQTVLSGQSPFKVNQHRHWKTAGFITIILAAIAVVAYLTSQFFVPNRGLDSVTAFVPRIMESAQSFIGFNTQSAATSSEDNIDANTAGTADVGKDTASNDTAIADGEVINDAEITEAESESQPASNSENAAPTLVSTPTLPENSATLADNQTESIAEANPETNPETTTNSTESTEGANANEVASDGATADEIALASDSAADVSQDISDSDADEREEAAVSAPIVQEGSQPETDSSDDGSLTVGSSTAGSTNANLVRGFTFLQEINLEDLIWSISINSEEQKLAAGMENGAVIVMTFIDDEVSQDLDELTGHEEEVLSVAFSPQQPTLLASASADGTVRLWDVETGEALYIFDEHTDEVSTVAFNLDGTILISGSADGTVRLWHMETGKATAVLGGENGWVLTSAFSPDGTQLATGTIDGTVQIWDVERLTKLETLEAHEDWTSSIAYSPSTGQLASASYDGSVLLWNLDEQSSTSPTDNQAYLPTGVVNSIVFDPSGQYLFGAQHNGSLLVWDLLNPEMHSILAGHDDAVRSVVFGPLGNYVATGALDGIVRIYQVDVE